MSAYINELNRGLAKQLAARPQPSRPQSLRQRFLDGIVASPSLHATAVFQCPSSRRRSNPKGNTSARCSWSWGGGANASGAGPGRTIASGSRHLVRAECTTKRRCRSAWTQKSGPDRGRYLKWAIAFGWARGQDVQSELCFGSAPFSGTPTGYRHHGASDMFDPATLAHLIGSAGAIVSLARGLNQFISGRPATKLTIARGDGTIVAQTVSSENVDATGCRAVASGRFFRQFGPGGRAMYVFRTDRPQS